MAETKEISDFAELGKLRLADEGYFVITDTARPAIVHRVNAKCITADSFNVKVVINKRKQGSYFWVDRLATAARVYGAKRCNVCKPELFLVPPATFDRSHSLIANEFDTDNRSFRGRSKIHTKATGALPRKWRHVEQDEIRGHADQLRSEQLPGENRPAGSGR